jgi:hypothetical protein
MIADDARSIGCGEGWQVRAFVGVKVAGPRQSGVEEALIAYPGGTTEFGQKQPVNGEQDVLLEPDGSTPTSHFASSRSVFR